MDRKEFLKKSTLGLSSALIGSTLISSCNKEPVNPPPISCPESAKETHGPYRMRTPSELVKANIVGDRSGVALVINITVLNVNNNCEPMPGVLVDIWHCDAHGNYSEYDNQPEGDFSDKQFLRGRQTADAGGNVSFISLFPGWYPGRAAHIHLEVLANDGSSILVSEIAFREDIANRVYETPNYLGPSSVANADDTKFSNSLTLNLADYIVGNNTDGYVLKKILRVHS